MVLNYGDLVPMHPEAHWLLCKFLSRQTGIPEIDECQFRKVEVPRGLGKTRLETISHTVQRILQNPNISILICNEREQNAVDYLSEIKNHFESNELLRALFPEVCPDPDHKDTWSSTRINVKRTTTRFEPTVFVIGVGGTVTGSHPDIIVVDDMLSREAMENSRVGGGQLMQQINRWLHQLRPLLNTGHQPFPEILFVGTRWWFGDSYEHIDEWLGYGEEPKQFLLRYKLPNGVTQTLPIVRIGDVVIFNRPVLEDGRPIHPTKKGWDLESLAKLRMEDAPLFAANMMNRPSDDVTAVFKAGWIQHYEWLNTGQVQFTDGVGKKQIKSLDTLEVTIYVDPGGFGVAQGADRARAAIVVVGDTGAGHYLVLDCFSEQDTFLGAIRQIAQFCHRYKPRKLKVESVAQQAAFIELVRREMAQQGILVTVEAVTPKNRDKDQRILQLEPFFQRGMVYIGRGSTFLDFRTQLEQFPRSSRKDLLDALAYAADDWARQSRSLRPAERQAQELATYRERRGLTYGA